MTGQYWTPGPLGAINPCAGCEHKSEACLNCYAEANHRVHHGAWTKYYREGGKKPSAEFYSRPFNEITLRPEQLAKFTKLAGTRKPHVVFIGNMTDLWHEKVPDEYIDQVFDAIFWLTNIKGRRDHTFLFLTKRAERLQAYMSEYVKHHRYDMISKHIWLGVTCENQARADERLPYLAKLKEMGCNTWGSFEPLLGPVSLYKAKPGDVVHLDTLYYSNVCGYALYDIEGNNGYGCSHSGQEEGDGDEKYCLPKSCPIARMLDEEDGHEEAEELMKLYDWPNRSLIKGLDVVVCGGESGPGARPMHPDWPLDLKKQCDSAGVRFYFKQWGLIQTSKGLVKFSSRDADGWGINAIMEQTLDDVCYKGRNPFTGEGY